MAIADSDTKTRPAGALAAIGLVCTGFLLFSLSDASVKVLLRDMDIIQIMFIQGFFGTAWLVLLGLVTEGKTAFKSEVYGLHILRGVFAVTIFGLNMVALRHIQLDEFYALSFTSPLWVVLLSVVFLKDRPGVQRIAAVIVGFGAVVYMLRPGGGEGLFGIGSLCVLMSAVLFATSFLMARAMPKGEGRILFGLTSSIMAPVLMLPFLPGAWEDFIAPGAMHYALMALIGIGGGTAALLIAQGFRIAPSSSTVAPFHYTQMIWGIVLGYAIFGDIPKTYVLAGAVVLVLTGIYLLRYESRNAKIERID